jgi:ribosomal-protein-alanine N-acetyltransferase
MMTLERGAEITVRHAVQADVDSIVQIENESFGDPWSRNDFKGLLGLPHCIFLVGAEGEAAITGYAIGMFVEDEAEILNIAVAQGHRGRGYGGMLLDSAIGELVAHGVASVFLEVRESNAHARALYASRGFEEVAKRRKYYRNPVEDALILRSAIKR